jgi:5'-3' exonuclease
MTPVNLIFKPDHKTERPIVVVDGMNLFIRLFVVNESVTTSGDPVGGVVGFIKYLNYLTYNFVPRKLVVVWEQGGASPRRKKIFEGYKANRAKDKESFKNIKDDTSKRSWLLGDQENKLKQLHLLTQVLKQMPVCQIYIPETECDDIAAYLLRNKFSKENARKILVSSDKDFYQLLENPSIEIYDPGKKILVSAEKILTEYNISPRNFCLARTMVGDTSDNIPGVEGIGLKTAAKRFPFLAEVDKDHQPKDIIEYCETKLKEKSKIKAYSDVGEAKEILQRNWELMYLDSSSMSASQIEKIDFIVDNFKPNLNKLGLIRTMIDAGVVTDIDFDRLSVLFKTTLVE